MRKLNKGFTLMEVLVSIILVGLLSVLCAAMLIFSYSMFNKVANQQRSVTDYKIFRFKMERIFRNMNQDGPMIGDLVLNDTGKPPTTPEEEKNCIKFDVDYFHVKYQSKVFTRKYDKPFQGTDATTRFWVPTSSVTDDGKWSGFVGRAVSVYSNIDKDIDPEKYGDLFYNRYLFRYEEAHKQVALYSWPAKTSGNALQKIESHEDQMEHYVINTDESKNDKEVVLKNVKDFQVTGRLSNLYISRIVRDDYKDIAVVRIYVQLDSQDYAQYTNDLVFSNKSLYGDLDNFFYPWVDATDQYNIRAM